MTAQLLIRLIAMTEHSAERQRLRTRLVKSGYQPSAEKKGIMERHDVGPDTLSATMAELRRLQAAHPHVSIHIIYAADLTIE
ncbi:hypothetical protein Ga0100231_023730 [Opitutaceae bacterium TAV4]|nr:hypothetical protein Ga0100231_023730 [Opitutaceae bacterium TAV4]RRK00887.1 hypothetical protein Ga0100230_024245 [Opitutaceae bacterium TAV3]